MKLNLVSLFDGIGGFPLAYCNVTNQQPETFRYWASEIEPWPIQVTRTRFPRVQELGDVTKIDADKLRKELNPWVWRALFKLEEAQNA